jgi:hypothetical protein
VIFRKGWNRRNTISVVGPRALITRETTFAIVIISRGTFIAFLVSTIAAIIGPARAGIGATHIGVIGPRALITREIIFAIGIPSRGTRLVQRYITSVITIAAVKFSETSAGIGAAHIGVVGRRASTTLETTFAIIIISRGAGLAFLVGTIAAIIGSAYAGISAAHICFVGPRALITHEITFAIGIPSRGTSLTQRFITSVISIFAAIKCSRRLRQNKRGRIYCDLEDPGRGVV